MEILGYVLFVLIVLLLLVLFILLGPGFIRHQRDDYAWWVDYKWWQIKRPGR